jgi:hypothetical protein
MSANGKKGRREREPQDGTEKIRTSFYNRVLILNKDIKCNVKISSCFLFGKCTE